jgi:hypothetical protein
LFVNSTIAEVLSYTSSCDLIRDSGTQFWRDAWIAAKICRHLNIDGNITSPVDDDNTEIDVKIKTFNHEYNIQCVECKNIGPRGKPSDHPHEEIDNLVHFDLSGSIGRKNPHINVFRRITSLIEQKENKYPTTLKNNLILFVYVNIYFTTREDLKVHKLIRELNKSGFKKIFLLNNGKAYRLAGSPIV